MYLLNLYRSLSAADLCLSAVSVRYMYLCVFYTLNVGPLEVIQFKQQLAEAQKSIY